MFTTVQGWGWGYGVMGTGMGMQTDVVETGTGIAGMGWRRLIEQGLTSHQTHYRSYRGRFLQVI